MAFFLAEREARFEAGISKNLTPTCIVHSSKIIDCSETILAVLKRQRRKNILCTAIVFTVGYWKGTMRHACISWISKKAIRRSALRNFKYITQLTCAVSFALHWLLAGSGRKHHAAVVLCNYSYLAWSTQKLCPKTIFSHAFGTTEYYYIHPLFIYLVVVNILLPLKDRCLRPFWCTSLRTNLITHKMPTTHTFFAPAKRRRIQNWNVNIGGVSTHGKP